MGRSHDLGDRTYFFEIIPDLLVITGYDGYIRDANTAWQNSVGWSRPELLAIPFLDFIHPEDRTRMQAELERVRKGIFMMFLESRFQCKDGSYKWLMWKAAGMPGRSKLYLLGREVVQAREAPSRRPDADRRSHLLDLEQAWLGCGAWEVELPNLRFWWSEGLATILGYHPGECPKTSEGAVQLVAPEDRDSLQRAMREAFRKGQSEVRFRAVRADGTQVALSGIVKGVRDRDGVPKTLSGVVRSEATEALPPSQMVPTEALAPAQMVSSEGTRAATG